MDTDGKSGRRSFVQRANNFASAFGVSKSVLIRVHPRLNFIVSKLNAPSISRVAPDTAHLHFDLAAALSMSRESSGVSSMLAAPRFSASRCSTTAARPGLGNYWTINPERPPAWFVGCWWLNVFLFRLFQRPVIPPVRMAMAVRSEEAAAELPEPRPDLLAVGLRNLQAGDFFAREKFKPPFRVNWRQ